MPLVGFSRSSLVSYLIAPVGPNSSKLRVTPSRVIRENLRLAAEADAERIA